VMIRRPIQQPAKPLFSIMQVRCNEYFHVVRSK
jgi:hypothetical protein